MSQSINWEKRRLGDLFLIKHGFAFKGEYFTDTGEYILLTPGNFQSDGGLKMKGDKEKFYSGPIPKEYVLDHNDLLIVMTDLTQEASILGSAAFVNIKDKLLHNQRLGKIVNLSSEVDCQFLYYVFNGQYFRGHIKATATGSTVRHTAPERIYRVEINVPPLEQQRKIADILSAYDDLIENNTRRIALLEGMARALYREWFVEFRFPGHGALEGGVPEGWTPRYLVELASIQYGFAFKSKQFVVTGKYKIVRIRDVLEGNSSSFTNEASNEKYFIENGDVLVGMDGDFHLGQWSGGEAYLVQRVARFRGKNGLPNLFVRLLLEKPILELNNSIVGTTVAHLGDKHIREIRFVLPDDKSLTLLGAKL